MVVVDVSNGHVVKKMQEKFQSMKKLMSNIQVRSGFAFPSLKKDTAAAATAEVKKPASKSSIMRTLGLHPNAAKPAEAIKLH